MSNELEPNKIIQGTDATLRFRIKEPGTGRNKDLAAATEISTCFDNTDGTKLLRSLTGGEIVVVAPSTLGEIDITITDAESDVLLPVPPTLIEILVDESGDKKKARIPDAYEVIEKVC